MVMININTTTTMMMTMLTVKTIMMTTTTTTMHMIYNLSTQQPHVCFLADISS